MEIWKETLVNPYYEVSNLGNVRSKDRPQKNRWGTFIKKGQLLKPYYTGKDRKYLKVDINRKSYAVHRLVAEVFIPNPENKPQVNHKDENPSNNRIDNLEWVTNKENCNYGTKMQNYYKAVKGISVKNSKDIIILNSMSEGKNLGFTVDGISACCRGKNKTHKGYTWRYIEKR